MRYYLPTSLNREEAFRIALLKAVIFAKTSGLSEIALATHSRSNLHSSAAERVLGKVAIQKLQKGQLTVESISLHLVTERIQSDMREGPLIALWVDPKFLSKLEADRRFTTTIYLPWTSGDEKCVSDNNQYTLLEEVPI